jgi:hypothetical protein
MDDLFDISQKKSLVSTLSNYVQKDADHSIREYSNNELHFKNNPSSHTLLYSE